jgi:hypothetical protein
MAYTTPRTWTTGETVTAAMMNTHVRDNTAYLKVEYDAIIKTPVFYLKCIAEDEALTTGDGLIYVTIPPAFNGKVLSIPHAAVYAASSSGLVTIQIHNVTDSVDMLSTKITIDESEYSSYTAATAPVVDTDNDDVATGDRLRIDVDVAGTGVTGLDIILSFEDA